MRKTISVLLVAALVAVFTLTGCGGSKESNDNTEAIRGTVESFLTALDKGDLEAASEYVDDDVFENGIMKDVEDLSDTGNEIYAALGFDEDDFSKENQEAMDDFMNSLMEELIQSYEIGDVSEEEEGIGSVTATLEYGYDPSKIESLDMVETNEKIVNKYTDENEKELKKIYEKDGVEAVNKAVVEGVLADLVKAYQKKILGLEGSSEKVQFKVEQKADKWVITEVNLAE